MGPHQPPDRRGAVISENTAGVHVSNILGKLGVSGRTEAAAIAVRLGLGGPRIDR